MEPHSDQPPIPAAATPDEDPLPALAREVALPYDHDEYVCPQCQQSIPTRRQYTLSKPARYAHLLNDIQKCPWCSFYFSYKQPSLRVFTR